MACGAPANSSGVGRAEMRVGGDAVAGADADADADEVQTGGG